MEIRKSTINDEKDILNIFNIAKEYMKTNGNSTQWGEKNILQKKY